MYCELGRRTGKNDPRGSCRPRSSRGRNTDTLAFTGLIARGAESRMIEIAEVLPPQPTPLWRMAKQCGVDHVVGTFAIPGDPAGVHPEQRPWSYTSLVRMKTAFNDGGFSLDVIESRPPLDRAKLGLAGRDEEIGYACELILVQHGQARHSGLVHGVDAGSQLDPHVDGCPRTGRRHGHRLRQRADEERPPDRRRRRHRGAALGQPEVLPRKGPAGRRRSRRQARHAPRRSAAVPPARHGADHAQRRELPEAPGGATWRRARPTASVCARATSP